VSHWRAVQPQGTTRRHNKVNDYHSGSSGWEDDQVKFSPSWKGSVTVAFRTSLSRPCAHPLHPFHNGKSCPYLVLEYHPTVYQGLASGPFEFVGYKHNYLLTPSSRVLLEKLNVSQLVKKFPAYYRTRKFITVLTSARHLSLS
jgi:hypothetical protein